MVCPSEEVIVAMFRGALSQGESSQVEDHIDDCPVCRALVVELARSSIATPISTTHPMTQDDAAAAILPEPASLRLSAGTEIGRYVVLNLVGFGGMGAVYAAYDPQLDRKVALKVLRPDVRWPSADLLREAQSLARLSHPNVVSVHDAGTFGNQVFLAMEFIDGKTLDDWITDRAASWEESLALCIAAGKGLAAAHEAGMVHHDFKPGNVLVDLQGRVRIVDFGLAKPTSSAGEDAEILSVDTDGVPTKRVFGTPAYMAPERRLGEPGDPRSDQYSYCLTVHEALRRSAAASDGSVSAPVTLPEAEGLPPLPRVVPAWLRRVLGRGLSQRPADRYPSIRALIADLERGRRAKRRRLLALATVAALACVAALVYLAQRPRENPCHGAARRLPAVWNQSRQKTVERAFRATGTPYASAVWVTVRSGLDGYASSWRRLRLDVCESARRRGEVTLETLERRIACLDRRLGELSALVRVLGEADAQVVREAPRAVAALPDAARCASSQPGPGLPLPPRNPAEKAEWDRAQALHARGLALNSSGKYRKGLGAARDAVQGARAIGAKALEADAMILRGELEMRLGKYRSARRTLIRGLWTAFGAGRDRTVARAAVILTRIGYHLAKYDEADEWARRANAGIRRLGSDAELLAKLAHNQGMVAHDRGRYREARSYFEKGLRVVRRRLGRNHLETGLMHNALGVVLWSLRAFKKALAHLEEAKRIYVGAVGELHPLVAQVFNNQGLVYQSAGELEKALARHRRSTEIRRVALGVDHVDYATGLSNLAIVQRRLGRYREAVANQRKALSIRRRVLGPDHPDVALSLQSLGTALRASGKVQEAVRSHEEALRIYRKKLGQNHPELARAFFALGECHRKLQQGAKALEYYRAALKIERGRRPTNRKRLAQTLLGAGRMLVSLGRRDTGVASLREALKTLALAQGTRVLRARVRFALALAIDAVDSQRGAAVRLAQKALSSLRERTSERRLYDRIRSWLSKRR